MRDEENPKIHFDKRVTRIEAYVVVAEASDWVHAARERMSWSVRTLNWTASESGVEHRA